MRTYVRMYVRITTPPSEARSERSEVPFRKNAFPIEKPTSETQKRIWLENGALSKPTFQKRYAQNHVDVNVDVDVDADPFCVFLYFYDNLLDFQISYVCITRIRFASPGRVCCAHEMSEKQILLEFDFFSMQLSPSGQLL